MEVKAVKAVTEVTLALTGEEASTLMNILNSSVVFDESTRTGRLAQSLYESLNDAGIEDPLPLLAYSVEAGGYFVERKT